MPVRTVDLAGKLIERIVTFLLGDKVSLSACSRVCRHWNASVKPILFSSIQLVSDDRDAPVPKAGGQKKKGGKNTTVKKPKAFDIVKHATPPTSVAQYVKDVDIVCRTVTPYDVSQVLLLFPSLERLSLKADIHRSKLKLPISDRWVPRPLKELRLTELIFSMDDWEPKPVTDASLLQGQPIQCALVELLNLFGTVDTLYLHDVFPSGRNDHSDRGSQCSCCYFTYPERKKDRLAIWTEAQKLSDEFTLKRILSSDHDSLFHFKGRGQDVVLDLLCRSPAALSTLETLEVNESLTITRELLEAAGGNLKHLRFNVTQPVEKKQKDFGISYCPNLVSAHVCYYTHMTGFSDAGMDTWYARLVATVQDSVKKLPVTLSRLTIELRCSNALIQKFDWAGMDQMLAERDLEECKVVFKYHAHEAPKSPEKVAVTFRKRMSRLVAKLGDNLRVECC
ncbi:hypothetical protein BXZ70DRAFT_1003083 [Cristinia sonorae]|uniref:F-box domain-containing protein n=1 Tax=Cristinia sonorae TaxID=1940300 RepID=A0A8K0UYW7_9AGAR|nr:hypothetical protein BXZ70DRAFT_1003083 [Cristinia sonorae]